MESVNITKAKMQAYEDVRQSGVTNMFMVTTVMQLSGLTKAECLDIMKNYATYMEKFGIKRG
jgi:Pyruvate/2-oxoacid:ferredoxin oxidoreductase gamma subunit